VAFLLRSKLYSVSGLTWGNNIAKKATSEVQVADIDIGTVLGLMTDKGRQRQAMALFNYRQ
jgi:hypothetical protein